LDNHPDAMPVPTPTIELLADHPDLIPAVGEIRWREWGSPEGPENLAGWVDITLRESGREHLPVTWVAIDPSGQALGAIALDHFDIQERRDLSPWVTGVIVAAQHRSQGIGGLLMRTLEAWACQHGISQAWVGTGGRAVDFYQKCGWELAEILNRPSGEEVTILTRSFLPVS
jgi:GNAT superfamily N-acetyltransferase